MVNELLDTYKNTEEKSIQSYPSPEFLNSLSFIKKFYPVLNLLHAPRVPQKQRGCSLLHLLAIRTHSISSVRKFALPAGAREKFTKGSHETEVISRHSEALLSRKNPADCCNTSKLKGIYMNKFPETDHASMPLGIFASTSVSCRHGNADLHLAAWLPSRLAAKKVAFTLAEVLITLGIIGVVAALTLPSVINKTQKLALEVAFKKSYANLYNAVNLVKQDSPDYLEDNSASSNFTLANLILEKYKSHDLAIKNWGDSDNYTNNVRTLTLKQGIMPECSQLFRPLGSYNLSDGSTIAFMNNCNSVWITLDTNGLQKKPNAYGHDIFLFKITAKGKFMPADSETGTIINENGEKVYDTNPEHNEKCSKTATSALNGITCGKYAIQNVCPDDPSKTYWECLQ